MTQSPTASTVGSAGRMAITFTAGNRMKVVAPPRISRVFITLLAIIVVTSQMTAQAHEFEHVLHQHEAPCALHVAAEHLTIVTSPVPPVVATPTPLASMPLSNASVLLPPCVRASDARAPPRSA